MCQRMNPTLLAPGPVNSCNVLIAPESALAQLQRLTVSHWQQEFRSLRHQVRIEGINVKGQ